MTQNIMSICCNPNVAAGVVVHQHRHVAIGIANCADMLMLLVYVQVADVQTGLRRTVGSAIAGFPAACRAASLGPAGIQRVVVDLSSAPQGKAPDERKVVEANVRVAMTLCDCAVCEEECQWQRKILGKDR